MKEETIATYTTKNFRLQLLKLTSDKLEYNHFNQYQIPTTGYKMRYQVRLNRKVIKTSISEYTMRKLFAKYIQIQVLQLKIY